MRRNPNEVLLMKNISILRENEMNWWIPCDYVSKDYVVNNRLCEAPYFFSTYTWYNNTAKNLLLNSAPNYSMYGGFGNNNIIYHRFTEMKNVIYGWNHYHIGMYDSVTGKTKTYPQIKDVNGNTIPSIHDVHSFFGLTYIRLANNSGFVSFPANP